VNKNIEIWKDRFVKEDNQQPAASIDNATALTGGALAAWEDIVAATKQDSLAKAAATLGTLYTTAVISGAPEEDRAGVEEILVDDLAGETLREIWKRTQ
jgi:hypothetical protein